MGFTTIQYVVAVALSLLFFVLVANFLVDVYARGAVRDALAEGARAGVPAGAAPGACEDRVHEVLDGLVRGPIGDDITVECRRDGAWVVAHASVVLPSWLPVLVPDWNMDLDAVALQEG